MLVIENGLVLSADEVVLQAYLNDQAMQHMKRCYATTPDAYMTERVQALRRVADRFLASSTSPVPSCRAQPGLPRRS